MEKQMTAIVSMESIPEVLFYRSCLYDDRRRDPEDPSAFLVLQADAQSRQSADLFPTVLAGFFCLTLKVVDEGTVEQSPHHGVPGCVDLPANVNESGIPLPPLPAEKTGKVGVWCLIRR